MEYKNYLLFFTPVLLTLYFIVLNFIFSLLTEKSDLAVFVGFSLLSILLLLTYLLIKFLKIKL